MIHENVLILCQRQGMSIRKLEQTVGLGNGVIGSWRHKVPRVDKLLLVADYFGVTLDDLVRGTNGKESDTV